MTVTRTDPVMIMVAPNGARRGKADHAALPVTAEEVAADAVLCRAAGASVLHMHVRDDDGAHVLDARRYLDATAAVEAATGGDMVVQITTEAVGTYTAQEQMSLVCDVMPVCASLALRELVPDAASHQVARAFFVWMQANRIAPQFILYDAQDLERFFELSDADVIPFTYPFLIFVLGRYASDQQSSPADLEPFLEVLGNRDVAWAMCAFGAQEAACAKAAMEAGGHVRVGFENNLHMADGQLAENNAAIVAATAAQARDLGFDVMTAQQARAFVAETLV